MTAQDSGPADDTTDGTAESGSADQLHEDQLHEDQLRVSAPGTSPLARWGSRGTAIVLSLGCIALLLVGFLIGYALRGNDSRDPNSLAAQIPASDSVEAGFSRDMIAHHLQGISMGNIAAAHTDDPEIRTMATDIATTQLTQVGHMQGWLDLWQLPELVTGPRMAWMVGSEHHMASMAPPATSSASQAPPPADLRTVDNSAGSTVINTADDSQFRALMPGMATTGEMALLDALRGKDSDVYFLQLMIRHHDGGRAMMDYAVDHATNPLVKNFARNMREAQVSEVSVMTQMLAARGAQPLP